MGLISVLLENYFTTPEDMMSTEGLIVASSATVQQGPVCGPAQLVQYLRQA